VGLGVLLGKWCCDACVAMDWAAVYVYVYVYVYVCIRLLSLVIRDLGRGGTGVCGMDLSLCRWPEGAALLFLFLQQD
jgi:hypothetical protein